MKYIFNNISLITFALAILISCAQKNDGTEDDHHEDDEHIISLTQEQYDLAKIEIGKIEKRLIGSELQVNGLIDVPPHSNISINMPYGGFVKSTGMLPGTKVKKGQLLVTIENPDFIEFQQNYLENLANQEFLKAEYERQKKLYEEEVASGKNFQQAKSNYQANEARVKTMEARLKLIGFNTAKIKEGSVSASVNIYSSVSGSVRDVYTNIGKYINPQDVIMDITNSEDLHVELTVYENDIPRVKEGQRIRFSLPSAPHQWREAKVFLVGSVVREDRSITVHGHLNEMYEDLKPGMYVAAKVETDSKEVWAIPEEALVRFRGKHYIFTYTYPEIQKNETVHHFEMIEVDKGYTEDGFSQITMPPSLNPDEIKLVTKGAFTLLAKAKNTEDEGGHGH